MLICFLIYMGSVQPGFSDNAGMMREVDDDHGLPQFPGRDPQDMLEATLASRPDGDLWVFGYGSLIWNPEVVHDEVRPAPRQRTAAPAPPD